VLVKVKEKAETTTGRERIRNGNSVFMMTVGWKLVELCLRTRGSTGSGRDRLAVDGKVVLI